MKRILLTLAALGTALTMQAKVVLPGIFGDNMVLQQQSEAQFWGKAPREGHAAPRGARKALRPTSAKTAALGDSLVCFGEHQIASVGAGVLNQVGGDVRTGEFGERARHQGGAVSSVTQRYALDVLSSLADSLSMSKRLTRRSVRCSPWRCCPVSWWFRCRSSRAGLPETIL